MSEIRVLVVPAVASEEPRIEQVSADHETFCSLVADINTDTVFFADGSGLVRVGAHAKTKAVQGPNPRATQVLEHVLPGFAKRDWIEGPAVFAGLDEDGDVTDVPEAVVAFAARLFGVPDSSDA